MTALRTLTHIHSQCLRNTVSCLVDMYPFTKLQKSGNLTAWRRCESGPQGVHSLSVSALCFSSAGNNYKPNLLSISATTALRAHTHTHTHYIHSHQSPHYPSPLPRSKLNTRVTTLRSGFLHQVYHFHILNQHNHQKPHESPSGLQRQTHIEPDEYTTDCVSLVYKTHNEVIIVKNEL